MEDFFDEDCYDEIFGGVNEFWYDREEDEDYAKRICQNIQDEYTSFQFVDKIKLNSEIKRLIRKIRRGHFDEITKSVNSIHSNFEEYSGEIFASVLLLRKKKYILSEKTIKYLIFYGADIHTPNSNGNTLLHQVCELRDVVCCSILIDSGVDINAVNNDGNTPLHVVCRNGCFPCCMELVNRGANIHIVNKKGKTPFDHACGNYTFDCENKNGRLKCARFLLDHGAKTRISTEPTFTNLHGACFECDNIELCQILIDSGADVNAVNHLGSTPLHCAARTKLVFLSFVSNCEFLLSHGANINAVDNKGRTPLHLAYKEGNTKVYKFLEEQGADKNILDYKGRKPCEAGMKKPRRIKIGDCERTK